MIRILKVSFFVFIVLFGLIIYALVPVMIGFTAPGEQKLRAVDGFIDLTEALSGQPDHIFQMDGVWEFYPDELYTH